MSKQLDILKLQLDDFFERAKEDTVSIKEDKSNNTYDINNSIYNLEMHLQKLKKKHQVNTSLNAAIESESITASFSYKNVDFLRSQDYLLSLLVFLCQTHETSAEKLREKLKEYTELISDRLIFKDIVITKTGVTRCYTNQRFALDELRKLGLVFKKDSRTNKRSIMPTPPGLLIIAYLLNDPDENPIHFIPLPIEKGNEENNQLLYNVLYKLKKSPVDFLAKLLKKYSGTLIEKTAQDIIHDYMNFLLTHLEIGPYSIKELETFKNAGKKYYEKLKAQEKLAEDLRQIIWKH